MRIAIFHNRYLQRGGEDRAVDAQVELLRKAGHEVQLFAVDNREEISGTRLGAPRAALTARWNGEMARRVDRFLDVHPVDVGHVHNFFPLLTPAVHAVVRQRGIPVVQTLHNYRLLCGNALFLRRGRPCEECVEFGPWHAVRHGCYRGSRLQTAVWADSMAHHRRRGSWDRWVDRFTTPSGFARRKLLATGIAPERLEVVPNPVADPGAPAPPGEGAVYVGRLSPEKGVATLIEAWRALDGRPLTLVGEGPEEARLRELARGVAGVHFAGAIPHAEVLRAISAAAIVVVPSLCYEVFPLAVVEAMASGRAVVAPRDTAPGEIVSESGAGLVFERGRAGSLARACAALFSDRERLRALGEEARAVFEARYAPDAWLARIEALYAELLGSRSAVRSASVATDS
jgi:glycosyltransferase involved in cell wall biosynthesis